MALTTIETGIPLVTEDTIAVANDYVIFLDGGATGNANKEQFSDVMTAIAGTGLSASSGVLNVDAAQTQITSVGTIGTGVWQGTAVAAAYMAQGTTSAKGALEIATSAEINTSTDADSQIVQLILEAPIGSVETLVQDAMYINLPGSFVTTYTGNNAERIKKISIPLLWIPGTNDDTSNWETNRLPIWNNYPGSQGYYIKTDSSHRGNPEVIGYSRYIQCLRDFIRDNDDKDPLLKSK